MVMGNGGTLYNDTSNGINNGTGYHNGARNGCHQEVLLQFTKTDEAETSFKPQSNMTRSLFTLTIVSALGGFLFGYNTSVVSGTMLLIRNEFNLNDIWHEGIVAVTIFTAWVGSLIAGPISDSFGRRPVILLSTIFYVFGIVFTGFSMNKETLVAGRAIVGMGIGLSSMVVPIYLSEVSPDSLRGRITVTNTLFLTGGQLVATLVCGAFATSNQGWRWMFRLGAVPAVIQFVGFIFAPESPRWLSKRGRSQEARTALCRFRPTNADLDAELKLYESSIDQNKSSSLLSLVRSGPVRKALILGCLLQFAQQITGINAISYYSASIMKMAGVADDSNAIWLSAGIAFFNFLFTFIGLYLVEHIGRRSLVLTSLVGMALGHLALAGSFQLIDDQSSPVVTPPSSLESSYCSQYLNCAQCTHDAICGFCYDVSNLNSSSSFCLLTNVSGNNQISMDGLCSISVSSYTFAYNWCPSHDYVWLSIVGLCIFISFYAPGMGCLPWTINSEIYPIWARARCTSVATSVNWATNLMVSLTFLSIMEFIKESGAFYLCMCFSMMCFTIFVLILPETKGIRLEEVEVTFEKPLLRNCPWSRDTKTEKRKEITNGNYKVVETR